MKTSGKLEGQGKFPPAGQYLTLALGQVSEDPSTPHNNVPGRYFSSGP